MSLDSSGVSIKILVNLDKNNKREFNVGYGFSEKNNSADAMRQAMEEFIASSEFKQLTETSLCNELNVRMEFLVHTTMPR